MSESDVIGLKGWEAKNDNSLIIRLLTCQKLSMKLVQKCSDCAALQVSRNVAQGHVYMVKDSRNSEVTLICACTLD